MVPDWRPGREERGIKVKKDLFHRQWPRDEGYIQLLFDDSPEAHGHGRILGGSIVGMHAGDNFGEIALAIETGAVNVDNGKTIRSPPVLSERIRMTAEVAHG